MAAVQGEVALVGRLQVGRRSLGVHTGEHMGQQGRAQPSSLCRLLGTQDEQVLVGRIMWIPFLHAVEPTQHRHGPQPKKPDQWRQQPQPLPARCLPRPGRRNPDGGRRPIPAHPYLVVREGQPTQAELHEGGQDTTAA
jgi:hypothetical protein